MSTEKTHKKYFKIADISIEVRSDLPLANNTFAPKFDCFEISEPYAENVVINHHFLTERQPETVNYSDELYFRPPWAIFQHEEKWVYRWIEREPPHNNYYQTIITDREHTYLDIYNDEAKKIQYLSGGLNSLTMFPTDQILTARVLAYKNGCIIHSVGVIMDGAGYLFVGHSDAGKSTMAILLQNEATILCDDRNIIRKNDGEFILSGTWSHGDVSSVSSQTAPLKAIFFLKQSDENKLNVVTDEIQIFENLLACLIRPLETRDWWDKSLDFLEQISARVPCNTIHFNKNGQVSDLIRNYRKAT